MPTYVYACDSCGTQFEQFQSFKDEPLRECPRCAQALRRVFQPVGVVFKGSGWYINDTRNASGTSSVDADKGDGKADKAKGEGDKGEAKAEAKPDKAEPSEKSSEPATKPASSGAPAPAA